MDRIMVGNGNIVTMPNREKILQDTKNTEQKPIREVTWTEWDEVTKSLAHQLQPAEYSGIYAIPRGGLLLGVQLSHALQIPLYTHHDGIRDGYQASIGPKHEGQGRIYRGHRWLVVDSIVDSGRTIRETRQHLDGFFDRHPHYATTYCDPDQLHLVDTYVQVKPANEWLGFPWEYKPIKEKDNGN